MYCITDLLHTRRTQRWQSVGWSAGPALCSQVAEKLPYACINHRPALLIDYDEILELNS